MTGGRVKRLKNYLGDDSFMLTYGDGLSNVNLEALKDYHSNHGKMVTVTTVRPVRFGELTIKDGLVSSFKEKPQTAEGWINGAFLL